MPEKRRYRKKPRKKRFPWLAVLVFTALVIYYLAEPRTGLLHRAFPFLPGRQQSVRISADLSDLPPYSGEPSIEINGNIPLFTEEEMEKARAASGGETDESAVTEQYGELDELGRCTGAFALIGPECMPEEEREDISGITPSGWHNAQYDGIDRSWLYNRCHLIGYQLTGQNANERNLITGTRYLNMEGMRPFEDSVGQYVRGTRRHVLYRVTPVFEGNNLLASGVLMEARSVEDPLVEFCVYCYNVEPGISIDYRTGESTGPPYTGSTGIAAKDDGSAGNAAGHEYGTGEADGTGQDSTNGAAAGIPGKSAAGASAGERDFRYVVNVSSMRFHRPDCEAAAEISPKNRREFSGTREELTEAGYSPCGICNP